MLSGRAAVSHCEHKIVREEKYMKRGLKIVAVIGIAAIMAGCSAKEGNDQIEQMDFHAQMEWKAPKPAVGERPKILFVGNRDRKSVV